MSLRLVTGGAGTGKTTRLLALMEEWLEHHPLRPGQRVLALTFMHGSRVRLAERLRATGIRGNFECMTFDGFARELCTRWRGRLAAMGCTLPSDDDDNIYEATCDAAEALLNDAAVARWVSSAHPLLVVDEFQDCYGARPKLVERLAQVGHVLVAADPFQDLRLIGENAAVATATRADVAPEELTTVHRTNVSALLAAASALRAGSSITHGVGLEVLSVRSRPLAASQVCVAIAKSNQANRGSPVVISAARPTSKNFAGVVINLVETTPGYGKNKNLGPYRVPWESSPDSHREALLTLYAPDDPPRSASEISRILPSENPLSRLMMEWLERERRLYGRSEFVASEVRARIRRAEAAYRALPRGGRGTRAMTIHQAKNREFASVIVLWPFGVPSEAELQRRWLYNAVTRAQRRAWIIIEDPKGDRTRKPPF